MRNALIASILFHIAVIVLAVVGLPASEPLPVEMVDTIDVEIADLTVTTRNMKSDPKEEPKEEEPPQPPPAPKPRPAPPPAPQPEPAPEPEPKPEPEPVAEPEPEPEPAPEPEVVEPEPEPEPAPPEEPEEKKVATVTPKAKPRPKPEKKKDDFDSMLKTLELDDESQPQKPEKKDEDFADSLDLDSIETDEKPKPQPKSQVATILGSRVTVSEKDAVKRQIEGCWNVDIGVRNPEELVVEIKVWVNRDRTVRNAVIVDSARAASDRFFRSMAESARRAVMNPKCSPLKLPPDKYDAWKEITLTFDPSKMVGR